MQILLSNSPWKKNGYYGVRAGSRWPHFEKEGSCYMPFPFFLAYSAAVLKGNGFKVELIDAIAEEMDLPTFFDRLNAADPDMVVYEVSTASIKQDLAIASETRKHFGDDAMIVFVGAHKEMYASTFLENHPDVDFIVIGEYEWTLLDLANNLGKSGNLSNVAGLIYRDKSGAVIQNDPRPLEKNLDRFPWPARESLPMQKYNDTPGGIPKPSLQLWASRGCPFNCIFCSWPQVMYSGSTYRTRSPQDVVDELAWCINKYGFKSFYFDDDTFNIGKARIIDLAAEIQKRKIQLPWAIMARADTMDRDMLLALKNAGLYALKYGVESASQNIVNSACKGLDLEVVKKTIRFTRELGIKYHLTFMFGLPNESWEDIQETIRFALDMDPDTLQFSIATPFPGSRFYTMMEEKGYLLSHDFDEYDGYSKAVIRTEHLTASDLERALHEANQQWHRHTFLRDVKSRKLDYLKYGLRHPLRAFDRAKEILGSERH